MTSVNETNQSWIWQEPSRVSSWNDRHFSKTVSDKHSDAAITETSSVRSSSDRSSSDRCSYTVSKRAYPDEFISDECETNCGKSSKQRSAKWQATYVHAHISRGHSGHCYAWLDCGMCPSLMLMGRCSYLHDYPSSWPATKRMKHKLEMEKQQCLWQERVIDSESDYDSDTDVDSDDEKETHLNHLKVFADTNDIENDRMNSKRRKYRHVSNNNSAETSDEGELIANGEYVG